jgi:hypothetical protein
MSQLLKGGVAPGLNLSQIFSKVKEAQILGGCNNIKPGKYLARLMVSKVDKNRKGIVFCATELKIVRVLEQVTDDTGKVISNRVGEMVNSYTDQASDYFDSDNKALVSALLGVEADDVDWTVCEMYYGPDQPLSGRVIEFECQRREPKMKKDQTMSKQFDKSKFLRAVPLEEVFGGLLDQATIDKYWPNNELKRMMESDNAILAAQSK